MAEVTEREFEYIVVGSGAGGGPVAANLAKAGASVLVLEAGGGPPEGDDYECHVPAFHTLASEKASMSWRYFVRHYESEEQQQRDSKYVADRRGVFYPRAGTLGGCTAHNAMIMVAPGNQDWDAIAQETGDPSWRAERMRGYFERLEACQYRPFSKMLKRLFGWNPSRHGFDGWLATSEVNPKLVAHDHDVVRIVTDSAYRAFFGLASPIERLKSFFKTKFDPNDWQGMSAGLEGIRLTPLSTLGGRRVGARQRLLSIQAKHPDRLTIRTGALATSLLFEGDRAVGVEYLEGGHAYRADPLFDGERPQVRKQVRATREVILSGGAFNTPQLLQLSGIGPAALLRQHGIPVRVDLPGVGANLQDRYEVGVVTRMKRPLRLIEGATMRPPEPPDKPDSFLQQWIDAGRGIYTSNGAVMAVLKKSDRARVSPDLLIFGLVTNFRGYYPGYSMDVCNARQYFSWTILKGYTNNRKGRVQIRSPDPRDPPDVNFHYFGEGSDSSGEDLEAVVNGVEFVRSMMKRYRDQLVEREEVPGDQVTTRDQIRQFVKDEAWGHHASCTCKIGPREDSTAVLDSRFRVHGTRGLRVVDASVFPRIPGLFIVSAIYMVAEKASDVILADREQ